MVAAEESYMLAALMLHCSTSSLPEEEFKHTVEVMQAVCSALPPCPADLCVYVRAFVCVVYMLTAAQGLRANKSLQS